MDLLCFLLAILFSLALGSKILSLLRLHDGQTSEEVFFSFGVGWLVIALLTSALGYSHAVYRLVFLALTLCGVGLLWSELFLIGRRLVGSARALFGDPFVSLICVLIAVPLAIGLVASLAPPTYMDVVLYHLELPRQYLGAHKVSYIPSIIYSLWPQYIEMIYLFAYTLRGEIVSQLVSWSFTPFFALGVYAMIRRKVSREFAALGALAFVCVGPVADYSAVAYVDIQTAFFAFLSVYSLLKFVEAYRGGWLFVCGLSAGLAAGAKMTSLLVPPVIAIVLLFALPRKIPRMKLVGLFLGISTLVAIPWYFTAYVATGNPVFPFFYKTLGGRNWNSLSDSFMHFLVAQHHYGGVSSLSELLLFVWNLFGATQRVLLVPLAFLPLVPFTLRIEREIKIILIVASACLLVTAFFVVEPRFHILSFALVLVPCALSAASLSRMGTYTKYLCYLIFMLGLATGLRADWGRNADAVRFVVSGEKREDYIQRHFPDYEAMQWMNRNLPADSRVLLWAFSGYYLDHDYLWMGPLRQGLIDFTKVDSPGKLIQRMEELKITHVYYRPGHREVVIPKALGTFPDMDSLHTDIEKDFLTALVSFGEAKIFKVDYSRSPRDLKHESATHPRTSFTLDLVP
jgi:hypothetical protein